MKIEENKTFINCEITENKKIKIRVGRNTYILDCSEEKDAKFTHAYGNAAGSYGKINIKSQSQIWEHIFNHIERVEKEQNIKEPK